MIKGIPFIYIYIYIYINLLEPHNPFLQKEKENLHCM